MIASTSSRTRLGGGSGTSIEENTSSHIIPATVVSLREDHDAWSTRLHVGEWAPGEGRLWIRRRILVRWDFGLYWWRKIRVEAVNPKTAEAEERNRDNNLA